MVKTNRGTIGLFETLSDTLILHRHIYNIDTFTLKLHFHIIIKFSLLIKNSSNYIYLYKWMYIKLH